MNKIFVGMRVFGHDASIFYIDINKKTIFAIDTERVTRIKHDQISSFPALELLLEQFGISEIKKLSISIPMKEFMNSNYFRKYRDARWTNYRKAYNIKYLKDEIEANKKKRVFKYKNFFQKYINYEQLAKNDKLNVPKYIEHHINNEIYPTSQIKMGISFYDHHLCHNIGSFAFSPFSKAIAISFDGIGDSHSFKAFYMSKQKKINYFLIANSNHTYKICDMQSNYGTPFNYYNSIASLYNFFTDLIGFLPNCDEGKTEALSAFGSVIGELLEEILECFSFPKEKSKRLYCSAEKVLLLMQKYELLKKYKKEDLAATIQKALEEVVLKTIESIFLMQDCDNLCLSGGVFANVTLNRKIFEAFDKKVYIFPAMGDNGSTSGSVILDLMKEYEWEDIQWIENETMPYWGPEYKLKDILTEIKNYNDFIDFEYIENFEQDISDEILNNKIIAIFQNRMEFGPRALGNRSIIANAFTLRTINYINNTIKKREKFQPFCPIVLEEDGDKIFKKFYYNFHMTSSFIVKDEIANTIPAMFHVDKTARVQFVNKTTNELLYNVLKIIKSKKGFGVAINTSFNLHGRTIVMTPKDAIVDFISSGIHYLYFNNIKVKKRF